MTFYDSADIEREFADQPDGGLEELRAAAEFYDSILQEEDERR